MQICLVAAIGLLISTSVARGITLIIFVSGFTSCMVALGFAFKRSILTSAYILLSGMACMLFAFAYTGAGLFDLAILGYPGLLIIAALLGSVGVFITVLLIIITQCILLTWLTLNHIITPYTPSLSWPHLVFIVVIFTITGFSVYLLVRDMKRLMLSLQGENIKVQQSKAHIQHLAHHDTLTNLPNRLFGEQLFQQSLLACQQKQQKLALFFIDLDNFKPVNDALGHAAGDELLKQLALRLSAILPPEHYLIRFGGDEFLVLAPTTVSDQQQLDVLAATLIQQSASVFTLLQTQVAVSASLGIACAPDDGTDFKQLCRKADIAMYKAKEDGRNTYHYYNDTLDQANNDKFKLLQLLRQAVAEQQLLLYYQPKICLSTGSVTAVEALLRWPQPDGSMISPDQFIPLAESSGLINQLGSWVLHQACSHCAQLRQQGFNALRVAVNLSVVQFKDGRLQSIVQDALNAAELPAQALELELTESLLIDNTDHIQRQLNGLSQIGVTLAIDDFGTGYSNLSYLRSFNASTLKIDRSFISNQAQWQANASLVQAIIQMAASLGLTTIAEGIENAEMAQRLAELGCNEGQGYYWSPAVPLAQLPALLAKLQRLQN
ncbi:putative bifunctional diguanylate cyclase/phosphodiesterase [Rheinheimera maricola]|uniref:EAL domain-containing protein n=1 Tax=Rheinheimera maricola TaxID=2793282 RepID=A0ABS7X7L0_9GAMM|nr:EAL domain-containing protein [Rheinheimera maricola]MBZ9611524.1 EAL domain-containing protein [Rheinheimera maricola]